MKIPIKIHPSFWILAFAIGWLNTLQILPALVWVGIITVSVLIHECGHALTAIAFKQRAAIELVIYGGLTRRTGRQLNKRQEFLVVFNGPLAGAVLSLTAYLIATAYSTQLNPNIFYILEVTWLINAFWTVLNLLPVYPLDGGQLLMILSQGIFGYKGTPIALLISTVFALAASVLFFLLQSLLAGALFLMLTFESYQQWKASKEITPFDDNPAIKHEMHLAEMLIHEGDIPGAENHLKHLLLTTSDGIIHTNAAIALAKLYFQQGRYRSAADLLSPIAGKLEGPNLEILVISALHAGDVQLASRYGDRAYQESPSYAIALANARINARLQKAVPAVGWFQCALRDGLPNAKEMATLPDFDSIRLTDNWKELMAKL